MGRLCGLDGAELRTRIDAVLEQTGLTAAAQRRIGGYSGGMTQRLGLAQALLHRPPVLFLDEPVSALDPAGRRDVLDLIAGLRGHTTVFMSTHILADVERVCDRIGIVDRGRLVVDATVAELQQRYAQPVIILEPEPGQDAQTAALVVALRAQPWVAEVDEAHGELRVTVHDPEVAGRRLVPLIAASGVALARLERGRPTLEDVFLRLVGDERAPGMSKGGGVMQAFRVLLHKEMAEARRTARLPIVAGLFLTLGFAAPLLAKYTPELAERASTGQLHIAAPSATTADAVDKLLGNLGQFGLLAAVVLSMGTIAREKERGTAALVLTKPVSRPAFLAAKVAAVGATLGLGVALAGAGAYAYTAVLFEPLPPAGFAVSCLLMLLALMAFAGITVLGTTVLRSSLAAAGMGLAAFAVVATISSLPNARRFTPLGLTEPARALALGQPPTHVRAARRARPAAASAASRPRRLTRAAGEHIVPLPRPGRRVWRRRVYCHRCGTQVREGNAFCTNCGERRLDAPRPAVSPAGATLVMQPDQPAPQEPTPRPPSQGGYAYGAGQPSPSPHAVVPPPGQQRLPPSQPYGLPPAAGARSAPMTALASLLPVAGGVLIAISPFLPWVRLSGFGRSETGTFREYLSDTDKPVVLLLVIFVIAAAAVAGGVLRSLGKLGGIPSRIWLAATGVAGVGEAFYQFVQFREEKDVLGSLPSGVSFNLTFGFWVLVAGCILVFAGILSDRGHSRGT